MGVFMKENRLKERKSYFAYKITDMSFLEQMHLGINNLLYILLGNAFLNHLDNPNFANIFYIMSIALVRAYMEGEVKDVVDESKQYRKDVKAAFSIKKDLAEIFLNPYSNFNEDDINKVAIKLSKDIMYIYDNSPTQNFDEKSIVNLVNFITGSTYKSFADLMFTHVQNELIEHQAYPYDVILLDNVVVSLIYKHYYQMIKNSALELRISLNDWLELRNIENHTSYELISEYINDKIKNDIYIEKVINDMLKIEKKAFRKDYAQALIIVKEYDRKTIIK